MGNGELLRVVLWSREEGETALPALFQSRDAHSLVRKSSKSRRGPTFDDGEMTGLENDDLHRVLQPGSAHLHERKHPDVGYP